MINKRNCSLAANNGFIFGQCCMLNDDMSLIVGICDKADAIIACDGRANNDDDSVLSETSLKTLRLNPYLCIGCTGHTDMIREALSAIGINTSDSPDDRIFWDWEESGRSIQKSPDEVRELLHQEITSMVRAAKTSKPRVACCVLANCHGHPFVCTWSSFNNWNPCGWQAWGIPVSFSIGEKLSSSKSDAHLSELIDFKAGTVGAEQRLVNAIHFAASDNKYKTINKKVYLRRMSTGFALRRAC